MIITSSPHDYDGMAFVLLLHLVFSTLSTDAPASIRKTLSKLPEKEKKKKKVRREVVVVEEEEEEGGGGGRKATDLSSCNKYSWEDGDINIDTIGPLAELTPVCIHF